MSDKVEKPKLTTLKLRHAITEAMQSAGLGSSSFRVRSSQVDYVCVEVVSFQPDKAIGALRDKLQSLCAIYDWQAPSFELHAPYGVWLHWYRTKDNKASGFVAGGELMPSA